MASTPRELESGAAGARALHGAEPVPLGEWLLRRVVYLFVRVLASTLRFRSEGLPEIQARLAAGDRVVLALWHETIALAVPFFEGYAIPVLVSASRDGARVAWIASAFGHRPVRGSSSRGGVRGLLELVRTIRAGTSLAAHFVDGPRGPAREVKPGLVALAQRSQSWIAPLTLVAEHGLRTRSWDRQQIPWPFSRVTVHVAPLIRVPDELDEAGAEALRKAVEQRMLDDFAAISAAGPPRTALPGRAIRIASRAR
jgi:lysophospholipid acyltransferase (LPLAT)-like uncharacterized protein